MIDIILLGWGVVSLVLVAYVSVGLDVSGGGSDGDI